MVNFYKNLSIGKKLYMGFSLVLIVMIVLSVMSTFNFSKQNETANWNYHTYDVLKEQQELLTSMINMETGQRGFMLTGNENSLEPYHTGKESFDVHFARVKELTSDNPKQQQLLDELNVRNEWMAIAESGIELRRQVSRGAADMNDVIREEQAARGKETFDRFRAILAESESIEQTLLEERKTVNDERVVFTNISLISGTVIGVALALIIAFMTTRTITRPIAEVKRAAEAIAAGDLNIDVQATSKDEIGMLAETFRQMSDNMNDVLTNIQVTSVQVNTGSSQVSDSSITISQGASEQASAVEELTSTMEQIGSQTNLNAERATKASELAMQVQNNAAQGNEQMQQMLSSMDEINEASGNISKIIKVIDEIAFQTNLLALNAAVEAARAGQHGKGFAVVAEEVRNLAARSASAAKETTELIEGSIKKAENGSQIANETAQALGDIVEGVTKVAELVEEIAAASQEQSTGITQVNQAINQVSQVTQTNSAISEETASASEELSSQAEVLLELVQRFHLKNEAGSDVNKA